MKLQGKAGSLQFLKSIGLKVPDFSIITHEEFLSWGDSFLLLEFCEVLKGTDGKAIKKSAEAFAATVKIPEIKLLNAFDEQFYAVRSSASVEDSLENSFAGIFETKLFVSKNLEESIKDVWKSLFHEKALEYCKARGISWTLLKMDVVVQAMIDGERSGVMFQADPVGKISDQVIVAGMGLGQGIVDELTDTDHYIVEKNAIKEKNIRHKEYGLVYDKQSKQLTKIKVQEDFSDVSILSDDDLNKLIKASSIISQHVNYFMDIEFTFKGSELYLLQARPITTLASKKSVLIFDNSNIAENYPGLTLPLTYTSLARAYTKNFKNLLRFLGLRDKDWAYINNNLEQLIGSWGGQVYYNLNNWYSVYTLMPFGGEKAAASFNEMIGISSNEIIKVPQRSILEKIMMSARLLPRLLSFFIFQGFYHQEFKKKFKDIHHKSSLEGESLKNSFEVIQLLDHLDNEYLAIIKIPLLNDFFSSILNSSCRSLARRLNSKDGEHFYNDLLSHSENLESSKAIYSIIELANQVRENQKLMSFLETHVKDNQIVSKLHSFLEFKLSLKNHLDRFGDRSQWEMKIEIPTARENPESTIKLLLEYAKNGLTQTEHKLREQEKNRKAKEAFKKTFKEKPFTYLLFKFLFSKCITSLCFREDSRFDRARFKGLNRGLALKLGKILVEKKWLHEVEDLFYLTFDEVRSLTHDSYGMDYWKELVALRKKHLSVFKDVNLPDRIVTNDMYAIQRFFEKNQLSDLQEIKGMACSGGVVEGLCEVVLDLNDVTSLKDKILVAKRTDPSWGYFFVGVKGIVIEKGSMLSHAAIIARELGIPCVINVKDATRIFKSGMKLRVNGDTGVVEKSI